MPLINVRTSISVVDNPEALLKDLSKELSVLTDKPEKYVMSLLNTNVPMSFAGTMEPCCYIEVKSIGSIDSSKMSAQITRLISRKMGISADRIYISFEDVPPALWGWDGRTFG